MAKPSNLVKPCNWINYVLFAHFLARNTKYKASLGVFYVISKVEELFDLHKASERDIIYWAAVEYSEWLFI